MLCVVDGAKLNSAMKQANIKFTYHDYLLLPDDKRYELVEGELLVVPAPNLFHQSILRELEAILYSYVRKHDLGKIFFAPCDVVLSFENVVQPDLLFVCKERLGILTDDNIQGPPDLIVEILSQATKHRDLNLKRKLYARYGVREYWIVDPEGKTVEVLSWNATGYHTEAAVPHTARMSSSLFPDLDLNLAEIF